MFTKIKEILLNKLSTNDNPNDIKLHIVETIKPVEIRFNKNDRYSKLLNKAFLLSWRLSLKGKTSNYLYLNGVSYIVYIPSTNTRDDFDQTDCVCSFQQHTNGANIVVVKHSYNENAPLITSYKELD